MNWEDKPEVKKGNLGEAIIDKYLRGKGLVPYFPAPGGAHPFDRLCASSDKQTIYVAEVKTKPRRVKYPDTGIDWKHYLDYQNIQAKYHIDVYLYFVDELEKAIYGGKLNALLQEHRVRNNGKQLWYPLKWNNILYFPLALMEPIATLSDEQVYELKRLSNRNNKYNEMYEAESQQMKLDSDQIPF